jgi:hypothetical protein
MEATGLKLMNDQRNAGKIQMEVRRPTRLNATFPHQKKAEGISQEERHLFTPTSE